MALKVNNRGLSATKKGAEDVQIRNGGIFNLPAEFHGFEEHQLFAPQPQTAPLLFKDASIQSDLKPSFK
jgi:hypothetical protein